jgi:hypothetical protein
MSQICGMLKNPGYISQALSGRYFRRGLWTREAPGGQSRND